MSNAVQDRMRQLIELLHGACEVYYAGTDEPIMTDLQYDKILVELMELEEATGVRLPESPTSKVGFREPNEEGRIKHFEPVLSLKDTKSIDDMLHFLGEQEGLVSWKLDGISIVLHYAYGTLQQALSRGDGQYGKDITENVKQMRNVPKTIRIKNNIIIRGEGCISLNKFEIIKRSQEGERYSNPRNMASGLVNATKTAPILLRHVNFIAHSAILLEGEGRQLTNKMSQFLYLKTLGFRVVEHWPVLNFELKRQIEALTTEVKDYEFPVDGLVLTLNDIQYGKSLGATAKYPKDSLAFKWPDECKVTKVTGMDWSVSQTGLITPIVIFEPVKLEGTIVKRANLHTLKIFEELSVGIGDVIRVYKANKIIPAVEENFTRSKTEEYPHECPVCGCYTRIVETELTRKLYCSHCREFNLQKQIAYDDNSQ